MGTTLLPIPDRLVVLTFDDGPKSQATFAAPLLQQCNFGATFYITEGLRFFEDKERYMTWEEASGLHQAGFEIGNHTRHHKDVTGQTPQELYDDVLHIDQRCAEHGIAKPETFCYPGYSNSPAAVDVLAKHGFLFARRGVMPEFPYDNEGGRGPAYDPKIHHPLLIPTTGASGPHWNFDDFLWALDQARDGKIAVLTFHGVPDLDHPWVDTTPDDFSAYVAHLRDNDFSVIALRDLCRYVDPSQYNPN